MPRISRPNVNVRGKARSGSGSGAAKNSFASLLLRFLTVCLIGASVLVPLAGNNFHADSSVGINTKTSALNSFSSQSNQDKHLQSSQQNVDQECLRQIEQVLTQPEEKILHNQVCASPQIAAILLKQSKHIQELQRKLYLRELRSYRISGLICDSHLDPEVPKVATEPAFKCLPKEYQRRACMDGRTTGLPDACSSFQRLDNPQQPVYIPEPERQKHSVNCDAPGASCNEIPLGDGKTTPVEAGQLANGVAEYNVVTLRNDQRYVWHKNALDVHLQLIKEGKDISPVHYLGAHKALQTAIDIISVQNKRVGIFGSISPWVESIVHYNGAQAPTITVDYNTPVSQDPERIQTKRMSTVLESLDDVFDVVVSYSSIEHDGQGRYGDPLDPDGDLAAMKEIWLKVAPGGYLLLHVPFGERDHFIWYSQRKYSTARIPVLIRGWEYVALATSEKLYQPKDAFVLSQVKELSPVLILRKPATVGVDELLDASKFGGLRCDKASGTCSAGAIQSI